MKKQMNNKLFLALFCIATHLEMHSMLRKTVTAAFMSNSKRLTDAIHFLKKAGFELKHHETDDTNSKQNETSKLEYVYLERKSAWGHLDYTSITISEFYSHCRVYLQEVEFRDMGKDSGCYVPDYSKFQVWDQIEDNWVRPNHLLDILKKIIKSE